MELILIIEDDEDILQSIEQVLLEEGYTVTSAKNGLEGLNALYGLQGRLKPDLVLLDLTIPELSGAEFLRAKNADPSVRSIPVIVVTASDIHKARANELENVLLVVHKPFDTVRLLNAVDCALNPRATNPSIL